MFQVEILLGTKIIMPEPSHDETFRKDAGHLREEMKVRFCILKTKV